MGRRVVTCVLAFAMLFVGAPWGMKVALAIDGGSGTASLTAIGAAYLQNFDSLTNSPDAFLSNVLPTGWMVSEAGTGARNDGKYAVGTGSSNSGDHYSFGTPVGNSDRALGELRSGSLIPIFGASFTNNTGAAITRLDLAYTGEQWRLGAARTAPDRDRVDFQYSLNATSLTVGTCVDVDALDFSSPIASGTAGALNGNLAANRTPRTATVLASVPVGATVWVRWTDFDVSSSDDGLAVDDFSLVPFDADTAPRVTATSPLANASDVPVGSNVEITFSEKVNAAGTWFAIACDVSGGHAAFVSTADSMTFSLDPSIDFTSLETCGVTVFADHVTDQDANDPPDNMAVDVTWSFTTADASVCGDPATSIHEVQGSGLTSPITGSVVTIEGVVVGDYQGAGQFSGYYVEEESADVDADLATSEGLFVFSSAAFRDVSVGDVVRVRGTVTELATSSGGVTANLTELTSLSRAVVCASGAAVSPATIPLPVVTYDDFERYEGMLVRFDQTLTATETFTLARFGEVRLAADGRLYTPTAVTNPGAAAIALADANRRRSFVLDDGNNQQNIDPTIHPVGGLSATNTLRSGYTVNALNGVFDHRFGAYRLQPVAPVPFAPTNPRTAAPRPVGGNTKVASFNVLNYFNGNGTHQAGAAGGFPTARGATTLLELDRQTAKEVSALRAMDADIVGLMEIENDAGAVSALADLVAALNTAVGAGTYAYVDTGVIGTDEIKVALIYKPATVTPVGAWRIIDSSVDARFIDTKNRPSLAQTFQRNATTEKVTVVVNHLKSKGSACDDVGDPDIGDGQANCNITRTNAAAAIADWLATDPTLSGAQNFLLIGDMNSYTFEDPIATFESKGFTNMVRAFGGLAAYSYVFNGESGYLDHALASSTLAARVTGATDWHINADEPIGLDYNTEFKTADQIDTYYDAGPYRSSDHDPVVIGLDLRTTTESLCAFTRTVVIAEGLANSLCVKLDAAAESLARGNVKAHDNQIDAFIHEVNAKRGKAISEADATLLIALAGTL